MPSTQKIGRLISSIDLLVRVAGMLIIGGMSLVVLIQVTARFIFNNPFPWPEEVAQWLLIGSAYIGSALVENRDIYIRVTVIESFISKKISKFSFLLSRFLLLGIQSLFLYGEILQFPYIRLNESAGGGISLLWIHIPVSIGICLWIICTSVSIINFLQKK